MTSATGEVEQPDGQRRIACYRATRAGAESAAAQVVAAGPVGVPHDRDKLVVHALVAADRMSQIPPVQEEITDAEPGKRRPVDVPLRVVRGAVQRPGTCEGLELRICALTGQDNRVSVETTLQGIREGVFSCRPDESATAKRLLEESFRVRRGRRTL